MTTQPQPGHEGPPGRTAVGGTGPNRRPPRPAPGGPDATSTGWTERGTRGSEVLGSLRGLWGRPRLRGASTLAEHTGRDRWSWIVVDSVAVLLLLAVATLAFGLTYGVGWLWVTCLGGAVLGVGVGVIGALRRFPTWLMAVIVAAVYLLCGSFLAMPEQATQAILPNARTLRGLVLGVVQAPRQSLTVDAPIGETGSLLVVPLITMLVAGVLAITLGLRSGRPGLAWLPCAGAMLLGIAFGVQTPYLPTLLGVAFFVIALVWTAYRRTVLRQSLLRQRRRSGWRILLSAAVVLVLSSSVAVAAQPLVESSAPRQVLRDAVVPPIDIRQYPSPLQGFRANLKDHRSDTLYTLTGLPEGALVRLATLEAYDGRTFTVSNSLRPGPGSFRRIGTRVPETTPGDRVEVEVRVGQGGGHWVPTVGQTTALSFDGPRRRELGDQLFYNPQTGTAVDTVPLAEGDSYRLEAVLPYQPAQAEFRDATPGSIDLPAVEQVPDEITDRGLAWAAAAQSPGAVAIRLEAELRKGFYSNGLENDVPSLSGHSAYRLAKLITDHDGQMIGDEEQYATAMALMARGQGLPARVVYGYRSSGDGSGEVAITGADVSAWVEINFEGYGWVVFQPTPDKSRIPQPEDNPQEAKPRPQVENPPPPAERPEQPPPDNTPPQPSQEDDDDPFSAIDWRLVLILLAAVGGPLLLIGGPVSTVLAMKAARRRRRLREPDLARRVLGGWAELVDRATDLGARPSRAATRQETATGWAETFPATAAGDQPAAWLASRADWVTFGPTPPTESQAGAYWTGVGAVVATMGRGVSRGRRLRAAVSLASFRTPR